MLNDRELTHELRLAFSEVTQTITPAPGLSTTVHRRHRNAHRRNRVLRYALPLVVAAGAGGALFAGQHHAAAPDAQRATTHTTRVRPQPTVRAASYVLTVPRHATSFRCVSDLSAPTSDDAWVVAQGKNDCLALVVRLDVALPSHAQPANLVGVPGLYQTIGTPKGVRTIYSRNPDGHSWSALSVAASTPDAKLAGFYAPSH
jgi:hypothetical protein